MYNLEDISLKIIRILYQLSQENSNFKASVEIIENRFNFLDRETGLEKIKKSLQALKLIGFIEQYNNNEIITYSIKQKGKKHYEQFKYLLDTPFEKNHSVFIQGNWTGNNHNYHVPYYYQNKITDLFPGQNIEFMEHFTDIIKEIEKLEKLIEVGAKETLLLEHLKNIKNIVNTNIEKQSPLYFKLDDLYLRLKNQLENLSQQLQHKFTHSH